MKKVSLSSVPLVLTFSLLAVCRNNSNNKANSSSNHIEATESESSWNAVSEDNPQ